MYIKAPDGSIKAQMTDTTREENRLTMTQPAYIQQATFQATDFRQLAKTAFALEFTSLLQYPEGTYVTITLDPSVYGPEKKEDGSTATIECFSNLQILVTCTFVDASTIKVTDLVVDDLIPGTHISLTLTNFEIFVTGPLTSESWVLKVYTKDDYFIETRDQGISLTFLCQEPCQTCKSGEPSICTSCNTLTGKNILYEDVCYERCPETTFYNKSDYGC